MKILKKKLIGSIGQSSAALALALAAGFAQAALVTQWGYSTNAEFSGATYTAGNSINDANISTASELSWGRSGADYKLPTANSSANRSALTVGDFSANPETKDGGGPAVGSVATDQDGILTAAEIGKGISLTHWNNVLNGNFATLTGATITDTITLTPQLPNAGSSTPGPTLTFSFNFRETPNNGAGGVCADGLSAVDNYAYSTNPSGGGCPDLFGFTGTSVVNQSFVYESVTYFASVLFLNADGTLDTVGIPALLAGECDALGFGSTTCFGFKTLEGEATTKRFGVAISAAPLSVPEPGSLALIGLAVLGLGIMRARTSL